MNQFYLAVAMLSLLGWTGISNAQETVRAADLRRDVEVARVDATAAAHELRAGLVDLVPLVPGWTCHEEERREETTALDPIPFARVDCEHAEQSLRLTLMLDPSSARAICQSIATQKLGIADGRIAPDRFRFFEGGGWQILRASVDLSGCAAGTVALKASGNRSDTAFARGPDVIDVFAEAILASDPSALEAKASAHAAALERLLEPLEAQARLLADLIPKLSKGTRVFTMPFSDGPIEVPVPIMLSESPGATATMRVEGCALFVEVTSSPVRINAPRASGLPWPKPGGKDGLVRGDFILRNTDGFVGFERVDGTGIEALVDNAVLVRVVIPGNHVCKAAPGIVRRLFEEILANDPASVVLP